MTPAAVCLFRGDRFDQLLRRAGLAGPDRLLRRVLVFWALTWLLPALLAVWSGVGFGVPVRESFFWDFPAYGQFCFALPGMLWLEPRIDRQVGWAIRFFRRSGLLLSEDNGRFREAIARLHGSKRRLEIDLAIVLFAYVSVYGWLHEELNDHLASWHARSAESLTMPGYWIALVSVPVWFSLLLRWVARLGFWILFLRRIARLRLRLVPTHPDRCGGLAFLGEVQAGFGVLVFLVGAAVASILYYKLEVTHASFAGFATAGPALAFVVVAPAAFLIPLFMFSNQLHAAKQSAWLRLSALAVREAEMESGSPQLDARGQGRAAGSPDAIARAFERVREMRIVPFDLGNVRRLVSAAVGPMLPVLAAHIPLLKPLVEALGKS